MYKLEVKESALGFMYIIYLGTMEITRGLRVDQHHARLDGIADLNICRHFQVGKTYET